MMPDDSRFATGEWCIQLKDDCGCVYSHRDRLLAVRGTIKR